MGEFQDSPVVGIGAGNFATPYLRERESVEEPLYPHSLPVMVLSQTGLIGALLFGGFLGCALAAVWLARSRRSPLGHAVAAAAVVTFAYWALHGSIDWFWEFPGLAGPAFAGSAMAGGLEAGPARSRPQIPGIAFPCQPPRAICWLSWRRSSLWGSLGLRRAKSSAPQTRGGPIPRMRIRSSTGRVRSTR